MDILTTNKNAQSELGQSSRSVPVQPRSYRRFARAAWPKVSCFTRLVLAGICVAMMSRSAAEAQAINEYQVKAAFLFNFAKFVEWPAESYSQNSGALVFGVLGDDSFSTTLEQTVQGKTVNGRNLVVRRLKSGQAASGCHILFIGASERKRLAQVLESLHGASVLTVGDFEPASGNSGVINFVMEQNKVRFVINSSTAEQARLKISAKLLVLAKQVRN